MQIEMAIKTRNSCIHMNSNVYSSSDDFFNKSEFNLLFHSLMATRWGEIHSLSEIEKTQKFQCVEFPVQWYFYGIFLAFSLEIMTFMREPAGINGAHILIITIQIQRASHLLAHLMVMKLMMRI